MKRLLPLTLAAALASTVPAMADGETAAAHNPGTKLDIGSPAPEFKVAAWIQGEPVTGFEAGKTYLIECWATWCGPCVAQIPHMNGLHQKYADKGLVVIGMNVSDGPLKRIEKFVGDRRDKMSYRVAFDGPKDGFFVKHWMDAAGVRPIPHTFVVRDGKGVPTEKGKNSTLRVWD